MQIPELVVGIVIGIFLSLAMAGYVGWCYYRHKYLRLRAIIFLATLIVGIEGELDK